MYSLQYDGVISDAMVEMKAGTEMRLVATNSVALCVGRSADVNGNDVWCVCPDFYKGRKKVYKNM